MYGGLCYIAVWQVLFQQVPGMGITHHNDNLASYPSSKERGRPGKNAVK